jgi:hypothetical protein
MLPSTWVKQRPAVAQEMTGEVRLVNRGLPCHQGVVVRVTLARLKGDAYLAEVRETITAWRGQQVRVCRLEGRRIRSEQLGLPSALCVRQMYSHPKADLYCHY